MLLSVAKDTKSISMKINIIEIMKTVTRFKQDVNFIVKSLSNLLKKFIG